MGKFVHDDVLDAGLLVIKNNASKIILCEGQPATYGQATTLKSGGGKKLGEKAVSGSGYTGPANGDVSGRKLTKGQETGVSVTESGDWDHIAEVDDANSRLLRVTPRSEGTLAITAGQAITVNAYKEEVKDPS